MMNLVVDIGNTRTKIGVFTNNHLFIAKHLSSIHEIEWDPFFKEYPCLYAIVGSVSCDRSQVTAILSKYCKVIEVTAKLKLPFSSDYHPIEQLGTDRVVALSAAACHFPNSSVLVIDAGTCITYDFKDQHNHHLGGAISPGLKMRYQALHHQTAQLPQLTPKTITKTYGTSTFESIHLGILNGLHYEINGFISSYYDRIHNFRIILTGGDADFLAENIKNSIFVDTNFILKGMHNLLLLNIKP